MMLYGMAVQLSNEDDSRMEHIVRPCFAALGLANDYFSFDREYNEFQRSEARSMTNSVWLFMHWDGLDVQRAKERVKEETIQREQEFQKARKSFEETYGAESPMLLSYLSGLSHQISGNVVWSLNCPRYHPDYRYDPNSGIEVLSTPRKDTTIRTDPEIACTQQLSSCLASWSPELELHALNFPGARTSIVSSSRNNNTSIANVRFRSPTLSSPTSFDSMERETSTIETSRSVSPEKCTKLYQDVRYLSQSSVISLPFALARLQPLRVYHNPAVSGYEEQDD